MKYRAQVEDLRFEVEIEEGGGMTLNGEPVNASLLKVGPLGLYSLLLDNESIELVVTETQQGYRVTLAGRVFDVSVADERQLRLAGARGGPAAPTGELLIKAPIPGLVSRLYVRAGDSVKANQALAILEAMKMENELRAPRDGAVTDVRVKAGERVDQGAVLLVLH